MQSNSFPHQPIGIFDSGVGGLSVLRAMRDLLPHENLLYVADQAHVPYGPRQKAQIRDFSVGIIEFLLAQGAKLIVVACNTASAAALHDLRNHFPEVPFVGMEPAVKPAAALTQTGRVGVLATPTTFAGQLYTNLIDRFAREIKLYQSTCPGLVEQIEKGELDTPATRSILEAALMPMLAEDVDTLVLGCTHYPFVIPLIQAISGSTVQTIDPAPAIARQTQHLLADRNWLNPDDAPGKLHFFTSGDPANLFTLLQRLLGETGPITQVSWMNHRLEKAA